eukprot:380517-Amphidinium_carterae.1
MDGKMCVCVLSGARRSVKSHATLHFLSARSTEWFGVVSSKTEGGLKPQKLPGIKLAPYARRGQHGHGDGGNKDWKETEREVMLTPKTHQQLWHHRVSRRQIIECGVMCLWLSTTEICGSRTTRQFSRACGLVDVDNETNRNAQTDLDV